MKSHFAAAALRGKRKIVQNEQTEPEGVHRYSER